MTTGRWRPSARMLASTFSSGTLRPVHLVQIILRAAVELHPDLVRLGEAFQTFLHLRPVQAGGVGDQHDFEKRKSAQRPDVDHFLQGFGKIRAPGSARRRRSTPRGAVAAARSATTGIAGVRATGPAGRSASVRCSSSAMTPTSSAVSADGVRRSTSQYRQSKLHSLSGFMFTPSDRPCARDEMTA